MGPNVVGLQGHFPPAPPCQGGQRPVYLVRVGHLQTQPITAAFLKETFLCRVSPDWLLKLYQPRTHTWLWARRWERAPLDATEHPRLGDWHSLGAELCQSQAP